MELKYKEALEEHDLSISELPEDAKIGITNINDVLKGIAMLEKKGKQPSQATYNKVRAMDKWVYYEILDYLNDTDKNEDEIPFESEEILEEIYKIKGQRPVVFGEKYIKNKSDKLELMPS